MPEAVANYAAYKKSRYKWMLGRFVVPVARLDEFADKRERAFFRMTKKRGDLSVLASDDIYETVRQIEEFQRANMRRIVICDALEVKAETSYRDQRNQRSFTDGFETYFEIPIGESISPI